MTAHFATAPRSPAPIWTTGSWLIYEYLEQAAPAARARMEEAIAAGDIAWHGLPFTTHTELMDPALLAFGLSLSKKLDKRFGKKTIAAKMTDVPGHTRSIIPFLAETNIAFLHIGVNPASTGPMVPEAFVWKGPADSDVVVLYSFGSYGSMHVIKDLPDALLFAHTGDNLGPPLPDEIRKIFAGIREQFPGTAVTASTLDAFAAKFLKIKNTLPVVTNEISDTWIHGAGSDPKKVARFRELLRLRTVWSDKGITANQLDQFNRAMLMIPEHTWGMDCKTHLGDYRHYAEISFSTARERDIVLASSVPKEYAAYAWALNKKATSYHTLESSWKEQRAYIDQAVEGLPSKELRAEARERLRRIAPRRPSAAGFKKMDPEKGFDARSWTAAFDPATGALSTLVDKTAKRALCALQTNPIGLFRYESFSQDDYDRFLAAYIVDIKRHGFWAIPDFSKPGMAHAVPRPCHCMYGPRLLSAYIKPARDATFVILELTMPEFAIKELGAPGQLFIEYAFRKKNIDITLQWFKKNACRLPEAAWFSFVPKVAQPGQWLLDKLGHPVSPLDVVDKGNRNLHAINTGVSYKGPDGVLAIASPDAPLVAPGEPRLLQFDNTQPPLEQGMHFNLVNNLWGTNFVMWYEDDARFRFSLTVSVENTTAK